MHARALHMPVALEAAHTRQRPRTPASAAFPVLTKFFKGLVVVDNAPPPDQASAMGRHAGDAGHELLQGRHSRRWEDRQLVGGGCQRLHAQGEAVHAGH